MARKFTMSLFSMLVGVLVFFLVVLFFGLCRCHVLRKPHMDFQTCWSMPKIRGSEISRNRHGRHPACLASLGISQTREGDGGCREPASQGHPEHRTRAAAGTSEKRHRAPGAQIGLRAPGWGLRLFHLAKDAKIDADDTKDSRQTVLDILCAHIRRTTGENEYRETYKSKPSEEIQSLLTLLFVQNHAVFKGLRINLQGSWLNGANLPGARLEKVDLTRAHLKRAILRKARLQGAILDEARLHGADLSQAYLQEAGLRKAQLQLAMLDGAKLQATNLAGVQLRAADLSWAYMHGAIFFDMAAGAAQFQGAILRNTELHEADLRKAQLQGSWIRNCAWPNFCTTNESVSRSG